MRCAKLNLIGHFIKTIDVTLPTDLLLLEDSSSDQGIHIPVFFPQTCGQNPVFTPRMFHPFPYRISIPTGGVLRILKRPSFFINTFPNCSSSLRYSHDLRTYPSLPKDSEDAIATLLGAYDCLHQNRSNPNHSPTQVPTKPVVPSIYALEMPNRKIESSGTPLVSNEITPPPNSAGLLARRSSESIYPSVTMLGKIQGNHSALWIRTGKR